MKIFYPCCPSAILTLLLLLLLGHHGLAIGEKEKGVEPAPWNMKMHTSPMGHFYYLGRAEFLDKRNHPIKPMEIFDLAAQAYKEHEAKLGRW